jgi:hypothetical protein
MVYHSLIHIQTEYNNKSTIFTFKSSCSNYMERRSQTRAPLHFTRFCTNEAPIVVHTGSLIVKVIYKYSFRDYSRTARAPELGTLVVCGLSTPGSRAYITLLLFDRTTTTQYCPK